MENGSKKKRMMIIKWEGREEKKRVERDAGMEGRHGCLSASHSDWANSPRGAHILSLSRSLPASSLFIYEAIFSPVTRIQTGGGWGAEERGEVGWRGGGRGGYITGGEMCCAWACQPASQPVSQQRAGELAAHEPTTGGEDSTRGAGGIKCTSIQKSGRKTHTHALTDTLTCASTQ